MKAELAIVERKILRAFKLQGKEVRLTTNPTGSWDNPSMHLEDGWSSTEAGWILNPEKFGKKNPSYCLFSRLETQWFPELGEQLIEAWLYTPAVRKMFGDKDSRELFKCFAHRSCLLELPLI